MSKLFYRLPRGARVFVCSWIAVNALALGLFVVGPNEYRMWFTENGICLEFAVNFALVIFGYTNWRE